MEVRDEGRALEGGRRWAMKDEGWVEGEGWRIRDAGRAMRGEGWRMRDMGLSARPGRPPPAVPFRTAVPPAGARGERGAAPAGTDRPQRPGADPPTPGVTWRFLLLHALLNAVRHRRAGGGLGPRFPLYIPLGTRRFKRNAKEGFFLQNVSPRARGVPALGIARRAFGVGTSPSTGADGKMSRSHGDFADLMKPLVSSKL